MRELRRRGLGALLESPRPLSPEAMDALACWRFMGGWCPERLPLWLALNPCADIEALLRRLEAIRDARDDALEPQDER